MGGDPCDRQKSWCFLFSTTLCIAKYCLGEAVIAKYCLGEAVSSDLVFSLSHTPLVLCPFSDIGTHSLLVMEGLVSHVSILLYFSYILLHLYVVLAFMWFVFLLVFYLHFTCELVRTFFSSIL